MSVPGARDRAGRPRALARRQGLRIRFTTPFALSVQ